MTLIEIFLRLPHTGFYPSDACECAKVDVVTETVSEFDPDLGKIFIESDQAKKVTNRCYCLRGSS